MSKNPKIEFFKLDLKPTNHNNKIIFKDLFIEIYKSENPKNTNVINGIFKEPDIMAGFYKYVYKNLDEKYKDNKKIKKAFSAKTIRENDVKKPSINLNKDMHLIEGIIAGGYYDTGKEIGTITDPKTATEKLKKDKILLDDFYFLIYTPLNKSTAILILQSYTTDSINDVFKPFIQSLFSFKAFSFNAVITEFMPQELQDRFKEHSIIKQFTFAKKIIGTSVKDPLFHNNNYNIKIEIRPEGDVKLSKLDAFTTAIEKFTLSFFGKDPKELKLEDFNKKKAYIISDEEHATESPFELEGNLDIKATIFLKNYIKVTDNGIPDFKELKEYALNILKTVVVPEIFPEINLK